MAAIATIRCPSCQVLNASDQTLCCHCFGPLLHEQAPVVHANTGETMHLYKASHGSALLLFSHTTLEYTAAAVAFSTAWHNVSTIVHTAEGPCLWLCQTPQHVKLPLGSGHLWSTDGTRSIPLGPFGYPHNDSLRRDLWCYAPQVRKWLPNH